MTVKHWCWSLPAVTAIALGAACFSPSTEKIGDATDNAPVGPKITTATTFDFGKVQQGELVEHVFKIRNEGDAELRIEKAHGS